MISAAMRDQNSSVLLSSPGFQDDMICIDVLHTWCLAIAQIVCGSLIYEWVRERPGGQQAAYVVLNQRLVTFNARQRQLEPNFAEMDVITKLMAQPKQKPWATRRR